MRIKKILFPTDFSRCSEQAFELAMSLARKHEAEIVMLHAIIIYDQADYLDTVPKLEEIYSQLKEVSIEQMAGLLKKHDCHDVKIEQVHIPAIAAGKMILDYTAMYDIDLIVMGTHGRRGLGHLFLGSLAERVVREAGCPVLTVRELAEPRDDEAITQILVPIDFSDYSIRSLAYARHLAKIFDARLQLLHVIERPLYASVYSGDNVTLFNSNPDLATKLMKELTDVFHKSPGPAVEGDVFVVEGRTAQEIVKFAQEKGSTMIVIPTHGLTGMKRMLLGSVAEKVVQLSPCPVFTLKSFGKQLI